MGFTAEDVKALREMTGVGMMDCKKALAASDGNMDKAVEFLREKGLAAAQKKASRIAAEGMVYANVFADGKAVVVEVNSETDFVAKNAAFQEFVANIAEVINNEEPKDVEDLLTKKMGDLTVDDVLKEKILSIGENLKIRRFSTFNTGVNVAYVHMAGKIGVIVNLEVSDNIKGNEAVVTVGKDLAMQMAALNPSFLDKDQVDQATLDKEKEILLIQAKEDPKNAGKPDAIIEKMVMGRVSKFYKENCLMQQEFVKDSSMSVEQYVASAAKQLGGTITVKAAIRFEKGEGLAKREDNFAEEVANMVK